MKKFLFPIFLLLGIFFILSSCSSDETNAETDTSVDFDDTVAWDGSIADNFKEGDGSAESPYKISNASQLAYLAKQVNSGNSYSGKHFSIVTDIDLNNIEWTPIGNGRYSFEGYLDGNNHSVSNLNITKLIAYKKKYTQETVTQGIAGLFGTCKDATISNLDICNASLSIDTITHYDQLYIGTLVAHQESNVNSEIQNISIFNSNITCIEPELSTNDQLRMYDNAYIGGVIGHLMIQNNSKFTMQQIHSTCTINNESANSRSNLTGGIIGYVNNYGDFSCSNFSNYTFAKFQPYNINYIGAFGNISNHPEKTVSISKGFSKIKTNRPNDTTSSVDNIYQALAIIGRTLQQKNSNETEDQTSFSFKELFGYVETTENGVNSNYNLYSLPEYINHSETNCKISEILPTNSAFDKNIWDLSDPHNPKIK